MEKYKSPMVTLRPRGTAANGCISIDQDSATRGGEVPLREILHRHRLSHNHQVVSLHLQQRKC